MCSNIWAQALRPKFQLHTLRCMGARSAPQKSVCTVYTQKYDFPPKGIEVFNSNGTHNSFVLFDCANCIRLVCTCVCSCRFSVNVFYTAYAWWAGEFGLENLDCNVLQEYADRVFDSWTMFLGNTLGGRVVECGWAQIAEAAGTEAESDMLARIFPAYQG